MTKTDASTTKLEDPKAEPKPEAAVIPEKYEFTAPEGYEVNPEFLEKATPVLKELGITQEGATKLFDIVQDHMVKAQTDIIDTYEKLRGDWRKEIFADKALGNGKDGLSPAASQDVAAAMGALPPDSVQAFKAAMDLTGAGDHPAFVKALAHFGSMLREGKIVPGGKPSPLGQKPPGAPPRSAASAIFPNLPSASQS